VKGGNAQLRKTSSLGGEGPEQRKPWVETPEKIDGKKKEQIGEGSERCDHGKR